MQHRLLDRPSSRSHSCSAQPALCQSQEHHTSAWDEMHACRAETVGRDVKQSVVDLLLFLLLTPPDGFGDHRSRGLGPKKEWGLGVVGAGREPA